MRKLIGALCMLLGLGLLLGAGFLLLDNRAQEEDAGDQADLVLAELKAQMASQPITRPQYTPLPQSDIASDLFVLGDAPQAVIETAVPVTPLPQSTGAPIRVPETLAPTAVPTAAPTASPTVSPTVSPTAAPTSVPTAAPASVPMAAPASVPTAAPASVPMAVPTSAPTAAPTATPAPTPVPTATPTPTPTPVPTPTPLPEMPTMEIKGRQYIGYLEIPTLGLSLPVMQKWTYNNLKIAPCLYWGNVYNDTMVILAHNYDRHFGRIKTLDIGDPVQFIDANGQIFRYVVSGHVTLKPSSVAKMMDRSESDLTLFTCTKGGRGRITVRLKRVDSY